MYLLNNIGFEILYWYVLWTLMKTVWRLNEANACDMGDLVNVIDGRNRI